MIKLYVFLGLVLAATALPEEEFVAPTQVAPDFRQFPNFNFTGFNLTAVNITGLNFTAAIQTIQNSINTQLSQFLTAIGGLLNLQPASQPATNVQRKEQVFIPLRSFLQSYRRPYYPSGFNPYYPPQRFYGNPVPYYARQPFYPVPYPEPSFQEPNVFARRPLQIDESLTDEEALEHLNNLKQELAEDQEGRLLPSISISSDKHTIVIVKPFLTNVISSGVSAASSAASAALSAASAGAAAASAVASAAASSASSVISSIVSAVTNANLTPVVTTKTILVPGISIG